MKISKKSWHYQWMVRFTSKYDVPTTLCGYFWKFVFLNILLVIGAGLGLAACFLAVTPFLALFNDGFAVPGVIVCLLYLFGFFIYLNDKYEYTGKVADKVGDVEFPTLRLIGEFAKAKKNKVCPLLDFVD